MPVRSLTQSLLRWPEPEQVLRQEADWAERLAPDHPGLQRVGVFGSYGRGETGVGSDLDLLLIDGRASGPQRGRLLLWPLGELPLSCDALVLTPAEHADLLAGDSAMAQALQRDCRWLWGRRPSLNHALAQTNREPKQRIEGGRDPGQPADRLRGPV